MRIARTRDESYYVNQRQRNVWCVTENIKQAMTTPLCGATRSVLVDIKRGAQINNGNCFEEKKSHTLKWIKDRARAESIEFDEY